MFASLRALRSGVLAAALLAAPAAHAQVAQTWLRDALTPTTPGIHKTPSVAVYPPQHIEVEFSHTMHLKAGVDCESCHDMVGDSKTAVDRNIPAHTQCETCHDIEAAKKGEKTDPESGCATCHPGIKGEDAPKNTFDANNIIFSHDSHLKRGTKCSECHAGVGKLELATRNNLPRMTTCLTCHDGAKAPNKCTECHLAEPDGVLRTRFASGTLAPTGTLRDDDHGRDFLKRHAFVAQQDAESCSACHRATECESCHAASSKAFRFHPADWTQRHSVEARSEAMQCASCHREQSFCINCHVQSGVAFQEGLRSPTGRITTAGGPKFHPAGFASASRTGGNHHSFEAMTNPESCIACHDEKSCLACHATTNIVTPGQAGHPLNTNPHPPGFANSAQACRALHAAPFSCAKCHGAGGNLTTLTARMPNCR
jgi:c(7)-type cytochrome triheme protein